MMYKIKLQECMISTNKYVYIYIYVCIYWHLVFKFRTVMYMYEGMWGAVSTQTTYIYTYIYTYMG